MIIGRLSAGESVTGAATRLSSLGPPPGLPGEPKIVLTDVAKAAIPAAARAGMSQFARLLAATVGLLLLIGCTSVGMLLLIRTEARRDEFGICLALGASRGRLARGIAIEGGLLATAGAAFALPVAWWLFWGVRAFQLPGNVSIELIELTLDGRALMASVAGAVFAMALITLVAAFGFSIDVSDVLRSRSGSTPRLRQRRTRAALVAGQVAVALVLLAGAGLFTRSIMEALSLNSALDMGRIVTGNVSLGPYGYNAPRAAAFFDDLFSRLTVNPTIRSVAFNVPQGGMTPAGKIVIDGVPRQFPSFVSYIPVDQHYFRTMGIPLLRGRDFSSDDRALAPPVVIVSESFGRLIADGGDPLGRRITASTNRPGQPPDIMEVVGVVSDVVISVSALEPLAMYFPIAQTDPRTNPLLSRSLAVRTAGDPDAARREIISAIKQMDPAVTPGPLLTLEERIGAQMSSQRFGAYIMGALGAIAILLTLLGTYVLAESMAVLRMREMGIRAALGATRRQLAAIVLAETLRLVGFGLAAGLLLAWTGANTIRAFLFRVQPLDPATLATMATLILILALTVSVRPALRAARVDIGHVLKEQ